MPDALGLAPSRPGRVLIFRVGSLGDTVVALPSLHLVARAFPEAERLVLTQIPSLVKAPPMSAILQHSGLIHGYLDYPSGLSFLGGVLHLRRQVRLLQPDMLIYLAPLRTFWQVVRDAVFFRICGIRRVVGLPWPASLRRRMPVPGDGEGYEHEAQRLVRALSALEVAEGPLCFDLGLTIVERNAAGVALSDLDPRHPILAVAPGTKIAVKEWGEPNWTNLMRLLATVLGSWNLVLVGSSDEAGLGERVSRGWPGRVINLCGKLNPRESAAALAQARLLICHDSGPMHLAAAAGIPCVSIFSARDLPGVWYPFGEGHEVVYHAVPCRNCRLTECPVHNKICIQGITPDEVLERVRRVLARFCLPSSSPPESQP